MTQLVLWGQLITKNVYPMAEHWSNFLKEKMSDPKGKKAITKDVWNMFMDFITITANNNENLSKVIEDGSWPLLIEEYAKYLKVRLSI